ncbi:MAG: phospholipase D-like domain-containing anti-phage protein [Waddliaceae bacterium]
MISRFSSRKERLEKQFLQPKLKGASSYHRIAGYFRSSILEIAGEELENLEGVARIACNSDICKEDMATLRAAEHAQRQSWCAGKPEELPSEGKERCARLHQLITSGKIEIKVLPDDVFGLIHGKAGVIRYADRPPTCFLGSINESQSSWTCNYELLWEDSSEEAVHWVQEEFDALWNSPYAYPLCQFVIDDLKRIANREEITKDEWLKAPDPESAIVESPINREQLGLWPHQKYFVKRAFEAHQEHKARFILADQVGLGKTIQLGFIAQLIAMTDREPVLILTPKSLLLQWFEELKDKFKIPCAMWDGKQWIDESGLLYRGSQRHSLSKAPRKIGIVPYSLVVRNKESWSELLSNRYSCVIVDEAHKARRKKINPKKIGKPSKDNLNNLLEFLSQISSQTKSMFLATATPVQIHPIEAWDLLWILSKGSDEVLGNPYSNWFKNPDKTLQLVMRKANLPNSLDQAWAWICNPIPGSNEADIFKQIREKTRLSSNLHVLTNEWKNLPIIIQTKINNILGIYRDDYNPFIRHIILRKRTFLEQKINPIDGEPYLKPIRVFRFGEKPQEAIDLPEYLMKAYHLAEDFCKSLQKRVRGAGFMKTMLLRRIGSSISAGTKTVNKFLEERPLSEEEEDEAEDEIEETAKSIYPLMPSEKEILNMCLEHLSFNKERDPKFSKIAQKLMQENWLERGCIVFSQYYDSIDDLAQFLSQKLPNETIAIYAGSKRSSLISRGKRKTIDRERIKQMVAERQLRLVLGTDAASEGLNLQKLGTLINLDLPWNPTRLEQRKGRIQRIGQEREEIYIYNMRYRDSVEDRVHQKLSDRLENIYSFFGQIPDTLESAWIDEALGTNTFNVTKVNQCDNPFNEKYSRVEDVNWESCTRVLSASDIQEVLRQEW